MTDINVLALVGSLRAASVNRQIAQVASENGPDGISVAVYDGLGDIRSITRTSTVPTHRPPRRASAPRLPTPTLFW
jgi:hypothetical protein